MAEQAHGGSDQVEGQRGLQRGLRYIREERNAKQQLGNHARVEHGRE